MNANPAAAPQGAAEPVVAPPRARRVAALNVLLVLALLYTAWAASSLLIPVVLAMALALVLMPPLRLLQRLRVPAWLGAATMLLGGVVAAAVMTNLLLRPAADWVRQAPSELRQHAPKLRELTRPFAEANRAANESISQITGSRAAIEAGPPAPAPRLWSLLAEAPALAASAVGILLLAYFFLLYGETLQRRAVDLLPTRVQRRVTLDILRTIQSDVSRYVVTIALINAALGLATAGALWAVGLPPRDALLWGLVAGLLNFAPYVGPLIALLALALVGMVAFQDLAQAALVPGVFLVLTVLEGQLLTPLVLGRQLSVSPLVLLLWLLLWGWLWGIAGILLGVPMLVCAKIIASRIEGWQGWAQVMEP